MAEELTTEILERLEKAARAPSKYQVLTYVYLDDLAALVSSYRDAISGLKNCDENPRENPQGVDWWLAEAHAEKDAAALAESLIKSSDNIFASSRTQEGTEKV